MEANIYNIYNLSKQFVYDYCKLRPLLGTRWGITIYVVSSPLIIIIEYSPPCSQ